MPNADKIQWPQGQPQFEVHWRAIAEALAGNGVIATGDLEVTATATDLEIEVATGSAFYNGSSHALGSAFTTTLSAGDSSNDRWDTVYFDTSTDSAGVREGTAGSNPEPPDIQGDEILLATIYVASQATDVTDSEILNWRTHSADADNTYLKDTGGEFTSDTIEGAFGEVIRESGDPLNGPLDLSSFSGSAPLDLGTNPAAFGAVVDMVVDSNSSQGTTHSYHFAIDGTNFLEIEAESDGSGGIQNAKVQLHQLVEVDGDIQTTGGTVIWDSSEGFVPNEQVQGLANFTSDEAFNAYPLEFGNDVDTELRTNDLTAESGSITVFDNTSNLVPRAVVDDKRTTTTQTSNYTTSDEEIIFVDSSSAAITITLASADAVDGNTITVVDVGDNASTNNITIDTEGSETIDGGSSTTITTDSGAQIFHSDDTNWFTGGGGGGGGGSGVTHSEIFEGRESGSVANGDQGIVTIDNLANGEGVEIYKAALTNADGSAVASSVDLELVTLDNAGGFTSQTVLITGDGATVFDDETGTPLGSYTNSSGGAQTIAVLVDNGSGGSVDIIAVVEGETGK